MEQRSPGRSLSIWTMTDRDSLLEVGCGSGALSIRAALTWPDAKGHWHRLLGSCLQLQTRLICEKNAASEGVASRCVFQHGDANHLDFPDESFDAVISNYVYHNIMGADMHKLLLESAAGAEKRRRLRAER